MEWEKREEMKRRVLSLKRESLRFMVQIRPHAHSGISSRLSPTRMRSKSERRELEGPTDCVYDFPTSSEGELPDIVDTDKEKAVDSSRGSKP